MPKLMTFVSAVLWLTVALAAIVRVTESGCIGSICGKSIEKIRKMSPCDRSEKKSRKLGKFLAKKLNEEFDSLQYDEVKSIVEELYDAYRIHKYTIMEKSDLTNQWRELIRLRESSLKCDEDFILKITYHSFNRFDNQHQSKYALECLNNHLSKCGHEERFKKITSSIEQMSGKRWDKHSTLGNCLEADYLQHRLVILNPGRRESELTPLLLALEEISALESISRGTDCSKEQGELTTDLLYWIANVNVCRQLFDDYLPLHLGACGFEERFRKVFDKIGQTEIKSQFSTEYPTLNDYLKKEFFPKVLKSEDSIGSEAHHLLMAIDEYPDDIDCTKGFHQQQTEWPASDVRSSGGLKQIYFAQYLDQCGFEKMFKEALDHIKQTSPDVADSVTCPTLHSCLKKNYWDDLALGHLLSLIKDFSTVKGISKEADCTDKLKTTLVEGLVSVRVFPGLQKLIEAYLSLYLNKCGFEERFNKVKTQLKIFPAESNLASYLFQGHLEGPIKLHAFVAKNLLSTLNGVNKLADQIEIGKSNCNEDIYDLVEELKLIENRANRSFSPRRLFGMYDNHNQACASGFIETAEGFKQANADRWAFIEKATKSINFQLLYNYAFKMNPNKELYENVIPDAAAKMNGHYKGPRDAEATKKFLSTLKEYCQAFLDYMDQEVHQLAQLPNKMVKKNEKVVEILKQYSCCMRVIDKKDQELESMFMKMNLPSYPEPIAGEYNYYSREPAKN